MALKVIINPSKIKPSEKEQINAILPELNKLFKDEDAVLLAGDIVVHSTYTQKWSNPFDALLITSKTIVLLELKKYKVKGTVTCDLQGKIKINGADEKEEVTVKGGNQGSPLEQVSINRVALINWVIDQLKVLGCQPRFKFDAVKEDDSTRFPAFVIIHGDDSTHPMGNPIKWKFDWAHIANNQTFVAELPDVLAQADKPTLKSRKAAPLSIPVSSFTDILGFTKNGECASDYKEMNPNANKSETTRTTESTGTRTRDRNQKQGQGQGPGTGTRDSDPEQGQEPGPGTGTSNQEQGQGPGTGKTVVISLVAILVAVSFIGFAIYKAVDVFRHPSEEKRIENTEVRTSPKAEQSYQDGIRAYQDGDMAEAEKCFAKASGKGHVKAAYNLGLMYYNDGKFDDALSLFKQAADSDDRDALFYLGVMYMEGKGVMKDSAKALNYWKKAIEKGSTEAMYSVGEYYYTLKNYTEALPYFKTAASLGHAASMYILSVFYDYGLGGLPHDPSQARAWENRALANGYVPYR